MQQVTEGFILTRHQVERAGQTWLEFWLSTESGPVKLVTSAQRFTFFVQQSELDKVSGYLTDSKIPFEAKPLSMFSFEQQQMAALYLNSGQSAFAAKDLLRAAGVNTYEDDIRLADRFLMERFIYGSAVFTGQIQPQEHYSVYQQARLKPSAYKPQFNILSLDIECSEQGELYSIGLAGQDYQSVLMIGEPQPGPDWLQWVKDESGLLARLIEVIQQQDPDIILGWNVVNFDFRLLLKRAELHGIALRLGRGQSLASWRDARAEVNQGYITLPGRVVVDGIDALKTATYQFDSFSLEFVAQTLLGKGKQTEDVDNRLAQITHDFMHNKVKLAEYNLQDCVLVNEIFEHTRLLDFLTLRSQLTGLELDRMGGSVAAFTNVYLPKLHRAGYISPNRPENGGLASPGGYVMDSRPGLYKNVLVLDFKSLYPSIIRTFKIDPLGLIEGLKSPEQAIQGYRGAKFSRDKHFLPDIITSLWQQRDEAKRNNDAARSQAIKILMNSFYGVLGSGGCRFYDTRLASSITMRGHDIMQTTAQWIKQAGHQVIYGDTDSTFVWLEGELSESQAQQIGKQLQDNINQQWQQKIADEFQLDCHLEIEFETHFKHFLMPTIRGSETGSKKRYAGIKSGKQGDELVFKGLETVRSDWTEVAKQFQTKLYAMVFAGENVQAYLRTIVDDIRNGHYDSSLVYRKRLRQLLDKYVKNVPPHVKAARLADEKNRQQGKALQYQHKGWVSYVITLNGPEPLEYLTSPIDYDHYIERQIRPVAEGILPFIGLDFEQLTSDQLGLF
ncbi:DNA polymerase II [Neptunicella sp. SCSIO 80796]|uniref:DNA polymerase II n=1 Tax=Neptunicella plasticusilytica TaxID=3117012 RepID=UPI003A4D2F3C